MGQKEWGKGRDIYLLKFQVHHDLEIYLLDSTADYDLICIFRLQSPNVYVF
jgi:hypothetical protein